MYKKIFLFLFFFLLFNVSFVLAEPPVTQVSDPQNTIAIAYPKYTYIPKDASFTLHIHAFNSTNLILPTDASCYLHLYDLTGSHTCQSQMEADSNGIDFKLDITSGNFTDIGEHSFIIYCNSSSQSGFADGIFIVTQSGEYYEERHETIVYVLIFAAAVCLFIGNWFNQEHWLLRSFFAFISIGFTMLSINSTIQLVGGTLRLYRMGTTGLTLIYVVMGLFFVYIFIYAFIEVINMFKNKGGIRWNFDQDKE